ncbi:MAG: type 4a pilus biogenesis protein PilO [Gemmatimonadota bacterium]|nr:MAG: type 4a pilus biogenesis protein PilO [Gemmatimonadota bacterium]
MALLPADPKGRMQALVLIMALVAAGWYVAKMYVLDPRQTEINVIRGQLENLETQNRRSRALAARRDDLNARMDLQERQLRIFEEFIPESEEVPELLDAISHEAQLTGVEMSRLRPSASESGEFYTKQTWELAVLGEYHDLGRYLTRIASLPRIIKPTGVTIALAPRSRATRDMQAPLEISLRIETFVLGAMRGAQPAQGQGASSRG